VLGARSDIGECVPLFFVHWSMAVLVLVTAIMVNLGSIRPYAMSSIGPQLGGDLAPAATGDIVGCVVTSPRGSSRVLPPRRTDVAWRAETHTGGLGRFLTMTVSRANCGGSWIFIYEIPILLPNSTFRPVHR